jgi:predicted metal-binding membrane protein
MMTLLGAMSLGLMALVTAIVLLERFWVHGYHLSRVVALVAFLLAAAVLRNPALAAGLPHPGMTMAPH